MGTLGLMGVAPVLLATAAGLVLVAVLLLVLVDEVEFAGFDATVPTGFELVDLLAGLGL